MRRSREQHLFQRRNAVTDTVQSDHAQGAHPLADGNLADISRVLARAMISLRISSLTVMASMMAIRPA